MDNGAILEMVIWRVPVSVEGSTHPFKYRLYFRKGGKRLVAYDNERGKGDHRHVRGKETIYTFVTPGKLIADFLGDVEDVRSAR